MIGFVVLSAPIFAVIALGWAALRAHLVPPGIIDALGAFSFRFALPALVFRLIASQPIGHSINPVFYGGYLATGSFVFACVLAVSKITSRRGIADAAAHATTATVSNLGFLGPPLAIAFFGARGAGPLAMALLAEIMVILSIGAVIMGIACRSDGTVAAHLLRGSIGNPVVAAIVLGIGLAATGVALPEPLDRFLGFLAGAAGPTALFAVGGALAVQRIDRNTVVAATAISAAKLAAYPLLVWFVLTRLLRVEAFWGEAGVLLASLPSGGSSYLLAQRYAADADQVSAAIVLSTLISVVTVPLAAWLVLR